MKKRLQGLMAGAIIGVLLASGAVFAKNIQETINAVYMNVKLVIDGEEITPKDVDGNVVEPFIYNGTTYLPVRAIGEAFNKDVYWDGQTATVYVGDIVKPAKEIYLYDRPYLECGNSSEFIAGKSKQFTDIDYFCKNFIGFDLEKYERNAETKRFEYNNYVTYPLNGLAKKVKGTFMPPQNRNEREYQFKFYNENNILLYQSPIMAGNTSPIDFEFEVETALKLRIECVATSSSYGPICAISNLAIFTTDY